jgi:SEC-C motif domain protein
MAVCPCGSKKKYATCCKPYLMGQRTPMTPEILMRSRYTAYTMANINYIKKTMSGKALIGFNETDAKHWAKQIKWIGLQVLHVILEEPNKGYVEFKATFMENTHLQSIHEKSEFIREQGSWYYVDGDQY